MRVFSDKDSEGEEHYCEEGVDTILLEDRGKTIPRCFLGHYVSKSGRIENFSLVRRFWE